MSALRLTRQDAPIVAVSTVASASLAAIFWVAAHHPAYAAPPQTLLPPPANTHSHQAQTLPAVHHTPSPAPNPGVVVLSDRHPATTTTTTKTSSSSPSPSPAPESSPRPPAQILSINPAPCLSVLVLHACAPSIGVTP